jgi:hypothetical protein
MLEALGACGFFVNDTRSGSADALTICQLRRVYSLNPVEGFRPPTLTGHKDTPVAVYFPGMQLPCPSPQLVVKLAELCTCLRWACVKANGGQVGCRTMPNTYSGEHVAEAARLEGKQPPALYSLARDGALHSYVFTHDVQPAGAPAQPSGSTADSLQSDDAAEHAVSAARPAFTG